MGISRYEKDLDEREEANQRFALGDDGYRLFKAAPDLLSALEDVVASAQANCSGSLANAITAGQEAIAKAKGGE